MIMKNLLPNIKSDLFAGTVVFLVALPLCLGIATASGVDPLAGLISGIIGGLVVAILSGSHLSVSGPAAGLIVIVVESIAQLGSYSAFLTAVALAGCLQYIFGLIKAGKLSNYVPTSVIKGMLAAIGLLLIMKQFPLAVGTTQQAMSEQFSNGGWRALFNEFSFTALFIAVSGLVILAAWEKPIIKRFTITKILPGPLAVVLFGIGVTALLNMVAPDIGLSSEHRITLPEFNSWSEFSSTLQLPEIRQLLNVDVWQVALTLAVVASLETLLNLEAVEQLDPEKRTAHPNRELKAQGIGNLVAGFAGGLPITSVIVRSSANVNAGAKSRMSAFIHGLLLLVSVFLLTEVINLIPLACLAAILVSTGYKLAKPALFSTMAKQGFERFVPFLATIIGIIATDLLIGIAIGLACAFLLTLKANLQSALVFASYDNHYLLTFRKDISFMFKVKLKEYLQSVPPNAILIIDATRSDYIDHEIREMLRTFIQEAPSQNISVVCKNLSVDSQLESSPVWWGNQRVFDSP